MDESKITDDIEKDSQLHDAEPSSENVPTADPSKPQSHFANDNSKMPPRRRRTHQDKSFTHPFGHAATGPEMLVDFEDSEDPYRPMNWTSSKKLSTLLTYGVIALGAAFNSAVFPAANDQVAAEFNVSTEVTALATSMILLGLALGPLVWGPLSELYGRKWVVLGPYVVCAMFVFGCGAAANIQTILITRFFQGIFSGGIYTNAGGVLGDIYSPQERGNALVVYSLSIVGGPLVAPIIGSAIVTSYLRWRWIMYFVGIFQLAATVLGILLLDESYAPVLLVSKARRLRHETGNWALHSRHEEWQVSLKEIGRKYLSRPFRLLMNPICILMCFYGSFVYGLIYGSLSAIPIVFERGRGWGPVVGSLPFLALLLGCVLGLAGNTFNQKLYARAMARNCGRPLPEARLYPMMVGSVLLAAGIFIFGWTVDLDVVWVVPCIGIVLIGAGFFPIFQASLNYVIDTFLPYAASAVATFTFTRSVVAAAFPLFIEPMLESLGIAWGLSLLGFIAVAMLPVPYLFFVFGKQIRSRGKMSSASV